jgi:hypothetical protein
VPDVVENSSFLNLAQALRAGKCFSEFSNSSLAWNVSERQVDDRLNSLRCNPILKEQRRKAHSVARINWVLEADLAPKAKMFFPLGELVTACDIHWDFVCLPRAAAKLISIFDSPFENPHESFQLAAQDQF